MEKKKYPLVVIGAGAAGLVVANGYAKAGKKVLLIEKGTYGGDCTNFGCIPSKSLIASAEYAHNIRNAQKMGIELENSSFQTDNVLKRVNEIVNRIRSHEDPPSLEKNGVDTLTGKAEFVDTHTMKVVTQDHEEIFIWGKKIVIAAGSSPHIPPVNGLSETPYLTNETVFSLTKIPKTMIVMGAGPIGCELAQSFSRLGTKVSIVHKNSRILNKEPPEAAELMHQVFQKEGIELYLDFQTDRVSYSDESFQLEIINSDSHKTIDAEQLLISSGRRANILALHLENADIETSNKGIITDKYGRTSQKHIYAIGDIAGPPFFTHLAENRARTVLANLFLPWPFRKKIDLAQPVPRVTYTDPEIASVGISTKEAEKKYGGKKIAVYHLPFSEIDRAVTQSKEEGYIEILTKKYSSEILGATIVGTRAGELLGEILLAMHENIPLRKLSSVIHPYPTFSLGLRQSADLWLKQTIIPLLRKK